MREIVELSLSKAVNVTNTSFIRTSVRNRMERDRLAAPPIELVRFHVFIHCTSGSGRHMVDFEDIELSAGTAIWIRPGQVQRWSEHHGDFEADVVVFASSSIPDLPLFARLDGDASVAHLGADSQPLADQIGWMAADLETNNDYAMGAAVVGVILRLFARHAFDESNEETPRHRLVAAFVRSIDRHIDQRQVAWHAREVGASTRSIARATDEVLGQRPKDVVDARVLLEAQRQLAWSDDDIATIARGLRFSEASNFTKFFRARSGASPTAFRAEARSISRSRQTVRQPPGPNS